MKQVRRTFEREVAKFEWEVTKFSPKVRKGTPAEDDEVKPEGPRWSSGGPKVEFGQALKSRWFEAAAKVQEKLQAGTNGTPQKKSSGQQRATKFGDVPEGKSSFR